MRVEPFELRRAALLEALSTRAMPVEQDLLVEDEAAAFLGVSPRTLQRWRYLGEGHGPCHRRVGAKRVMYLRSDLIEFLAAAKRTESVRRKRVA